MRILSLPDEVLRLVDEKKISTGHAKILVGLDNCVFVANKIIENKFSVRQTENFVKIFKKSKSILKSKKDGNIQDLEKTLTEKLGIRVSIKNKKNNKGLISFEYTDLDQLNKLIELIKNYY